MTNRSIRYSEDFKKTIVKLYREGKRSACMVVYGIMTYVVLKCPEKFKVAEMEH